MSSDDEEARDGRSARVEEGRRRVGEALVALVRERGILPDVATVAARAGVGRRTVFRYFDGVGALELETARVMRRLVTEQHPLPLPEGDLACRLDALLRHRADLYEWVTPVRLLLDAARTRGNAGVEEFIDEARRMLRANLRAMLADELLAQPHARIGLELATSWEAWHALRRGQKCSVARARREIERIVRALLGVPWR